VKDGEIIIVDEFTGRLKPGRRFSEGLHQAIEAKEDVPIKQESKTMATITFQNFFRLYERIAGMTGTAATEEEEFMKIYGMDVMVVPTHRPMVRRDLQDKVFKTESGKLDALVRDVRALHEQGEPVLIGTISIDHNEILSERLTRAGVPHEVLNAKNHEREAQIISQAGKAGAVTVATNMAGRGVDIILGGVPRDDGRVARVRDLGGLVVIGSERHESRRIDNQLRGRSGRQGDPGMSQFYVSMEDDLMRIFGSGRMQGLMQRLGIPDDMPIENGLISRSIETAQKKVEGYNFDIRKHLVEYDDVVNRHRTVIYRRRKKILDMPVDSEYLRHEILHLVEEEIEQVVSFHTATDDEHQWDIEEIYEVVDTIFSVAVQDRVKMDDIRSHAGNKREDAESRTMLIRYLVTLARKRYAEVEQRVGDARIMRETERQLMLRTIDTLWITHLDQMEYLRTGIGLRGYGQRDPLVEYKKEAYTLFTQLMSDIQSQIVHTIYKVGDAVRIAPPPTRRTLIEQAPEKTMSDRSRQFAFAASGNIAAPAQAGAITSTESAREPEQKARTAEGKKVGRNDPCPCGSGKKYKKCHGA
ncbi:MAG: SEC-C domain-containing protein, partial [Candidatus Kerfeldbacteria bacterium]|nr:SEC-C domain-containing protein [Candidatus Kerfeldbacteria bacterium]